MVQRALQVLGIAVLLLVGGALLHYSWQSGKLAILLIGPAMVLAFIWQVPRRLSASGERRDRADFRLLMARLTAIPDAEPADPNDYLAPATYQDQVAGQRWREEKFGVGFNQWSELVPIDHR